MLNLQKLNLEKNKEYLIFNKNTIDNFKIELKNYFLEIENLEKEYINEIKNFKKVKKKFFFIYFY
jgi:hypothetical protein